MATTTTKKKVSSNSLSETGKSEKPKKRNDSKSLGQSTNKADASVIRELKALYSKKLLPIEKKYLFSKFNQNEILDAELGAKPSVLLIGQYSTGKTSFIKHLIGMEYPEMHIGPEPTTDRFIAVVHGEEMQTIKGNALTGVNELPFSGLSTFGSSFLNKFSAAVLPAPLLTECNIIDTPGVLSGEKQRLSRGYDFAKVSRWFAERSDLILLLFDCSKLDISDEFKSVIEELQPHEDKVHCVLNKADQLDQESLMRVYGALLWSMGRIFKGAEVTRIYVGSFRDEPISREEHKPLFDKDKKVLMAHLAQLPKACSMRKINEMVKRIRLAVVHVCVMGHLQSQMPYLWGNEAKQAYLIEHLQDIFTDVRRRYQLSEGDFPKLDEYKACLALLDISKFPRLDRKVLNNLQEMLLEDIPAIITHVAGTNVGDGDNDDEDDETDGQLRDKLKNNYQPGLFTIDGIASEDSKKVKLPLIIALITLLMVVVSIAVAVYMDVIQIKSNNVQLDFKNIPQFLSSLSPTSPSS